MSNHPRIISAYPFSQESQALLSEAAQADILCLVSLDEFQSRLREAEILCSYWMPQNWQELAPNLHWLQCSGAGVDG
ncbi:MAG TPA: D-2-hydroxyacid dehydrogenase, partial [Ktedonobacteraceae bacterium]